MKDIRSALIRETMRDLENRIRAESISGSYLKLYAGTNWISEISSINNQVIYGRRGSGKTHLLRACQESQVADIEKKRILPVYLDLRKLLPVASVFQNDYNSYAELSFQQVLLEILKSLMDNIHVILGLNGFDKTEKAMIAIKAKKIQKTAKEIMSILDPSKFESSGSADVDNVNRKSTSGSAQISTEPSVELKGEATSEEKFTKQVVNYRNMYEVSESLANMLLDLDIKKLYCYLDEWSELPLKAQPHLADLIKKAFITNNIVFKIAAIPNRTNLGYSASDGFIGLEDGGDIFGVDLDNRNIYELNADSTKYFFNELISKQFSIFEDKYSDLIVTSKQYPYLDLFFTHVSIKELLIASAGIPRDFINLFIRSYQYFLDGNPNAKKIGVRAIRNATVDWYNTDKRRLVSSDHNCELLLRKLLEEIVLKKKKTHFLVPKELSKNTTFAKLVDLRVVHLRKRGYSHKHIPGKSYDVYSIDYGSYNSLSVSLKRLDNSLVQNLQSVDNLREIRQVSLGDEFFNDFLLESGDAFICPHCHLPVDTTHMLYKKSKVYVQIAMKKFDY